MLSATSRLERMFEDEEFTSLLELKLNEEKCVWRLLRRHHRREELARSTIHLDTTVL